MEAAEHGGLRFKRARRNLHRYSSMAKLARIGHMHGNRVPKAPCHASSYQEEK